MSAHRYELRVRWSDVDAYGHVNNVVYFEYFQEARISFLAELSGTTDAMTSTYDTATERVGVCRDFAHLLISFCRAPGVPARYVSAYALGLEPPDFHGYVQVYLGGAWHNVDATYEGVRPALVPIAVGRDAADVAMMTLWGRATLREQSVEVREVNG